MPLYEYKCTECGNEFELFKSFKESDDDEVCPKCGKIAKREIVDCGAVIYKGSGFYCKDSSSCSGCSGK